MNARSPDLDRLQTLFMHLITAPEGVARGCEALAEKNDVLAGDLSGVIDGDAKLDATEHLDIYADMYFYRLLDCLAEDFPRLLHFIGSDAFNDLVTDYLLAHPPSHHSLRELGRALPDYLQDHALSHGKPWLTDLTRLEWARIDVFDDRDGASLNRDTLLAGEAAAPGAFRLARIPASRLLALNAEAITAWKTDGAEPQTATVHSIPVIVWRKDFAIHHRSLDSDEARCLRALEEANPTVEGIANELMAHEHERAADGDVSTRLAALLERWFIDELVVAAQTD